MKLLGIAALVAAALTATFYLASWHSLGRGGEGRIAEAFRAQALGMEIAGDRIPVQQRFNDCLITIMALEQREPREKLFVSPVNPADPTQDVCRDLNDGTGPNATAYYHNYLHGQTVLLRYLLPHFEVAGIKAFTKALLTILLLASAAVSLLRLIDGSRREESLVFLVATLAFGRFFGLEWFGEMLGNGPSDLIVIGFLAILSVRAGAMGAREWIVGAAIFGALTMMFELLTGGLPLGGAMVLGLGWFALRKAERSPHLVALGLVAFGLGAAIPALTKVVLVASLFGTGDLFQMGIEALNRVGSELPPGWTELTVTSQLLLNLESLTPGTWVTAAGTLCLALGLGAVSLARHRDPECLLLAASATLIFLWFALFRQHTALHASFMVRILVWPIAAGFALVALAALRANRVQPV
ncbi:hypothetical protein V6R86_06395 [Sphingomonas kaistensis]|uniref:Glycosyltransferase RgtA/B/C/D-like domain-containing protein n=1 Tax=Sphingomonas kaistensis TaxID=298708 RepID=A0ABZ2G2N2_9SPHN